MVLLNNQSDFSWYCKTTGNNSSYKAAIVSICATLLCACANLGGPDYQNSKFSAKEAWSLTTQNQISAVEAIQPDWWKNFNDSELNKLVKQAIADSPDIKILAARTDAAGIGLKQEQFTNLPKLGTGSTTQLTQTPLSGTQNYGANLSGLSWEVDFWNKIRKGVKAQQAEYKASEADYRAGYLTLVSDVAITYFQIRDLDERIATQQHALNNNHQILSVYQSQFREGLVAKTAVLQQQAELNNLQKELLDLQRERTVTENRLATLLGVPAGNLQISQAPLSKTVRAPVVPAGLPADLLARRPDILAAEYRVLSAHELVGQTRLNKLPSITLTGSGGLASALLSTLLNSWSLGLGIAVNLPILDPTLNLRIKGSEIQHQISKEEYRKVVLQAFEEVESALANLANRKAQANELKRQIAQLQVVNDQTQAQLREGMVPQLELFESERSLLAAQQSLLQTNLQILQDTVTLYKALGGGWSKETVQSAKR